MLSFYPYRLICIRLIMLGRGNAQHYGNSYKIKIILLYYLYFQGFSTILRYHSSQEKFSPPQLSVLFLCEVCTDHASSYSIRPLFPMLTLSSSAFRNSIQYLFWNSVTSHPLQMSKLSHSSFLCYLSNSNSNSWRFIISLISKFLIFAFLDLLAALLQKSIFVTNNLFSWCLSNFQVSVLVI